MSSNDSWYFAYGSNLNIGQKTSRTGSIRRSIPCKLLGYRLAFNKRGNNGSVYANIIPEMGSTVWGIAYLCSPSALSAMDRYEGVSEGHYLQCDVELVSQSGEILRAVTYIAGSAHVCEDGSPADEYLNLIVEGAVSHGLPEDYIESIKRIAGRL